MSSLHCRRAGAHQRVRTGADCRPFVRVLLWYRGGHHTARLFLAFAGAGIARANPFKTGVTAVKLAIAAFIVPYIFVYNPIIVLMEYDTALAASRRCDCPDWHGCRQQFRHRFLRSPIERLGRDSFCLSRVVLISPENISDVVGLVVIAFIWLLQKRRADKTRS